MYRCRYCRLNAISRKILSNAAGAICGMDSPGDRSAGERPAIAATMFGVTTPCVTAARHHLEERGYEVLVSMLLDLGAKQWTAHSRRRHSGRARYTTTELADELVGGCFECGTSRLEAAGLKGIPQVVCPGAIDMVNFGPIDSVPGGFGNATCMLITIRDTHAHHA